MEDKAFKYTNDTHAKGVLGVLEGPCADIVAETRNGRFYSEELWDKVFADPIVKEMLDCGGIFGEAQHPEERLETDVEKIAIAMKEPPVKKGGNLWGRFYILDTPCGRILKTIADFGYRVGISSRGDGDIKTDYATGKEYVDPDTYDFKGFDAVLIPSVKAARLNLVDEGLGADKDLQPILNESLSREKELGFGKIAEDYVQHLNEGLSERGHNKKGNKTRLVEDGKSKSRNSHVADNVGTGMLTDLQDALRRNKTLTEQVQATREELSVSHAEVARLKEELERCQKSAQKPIAENKASSKATGKEKDLSLRVSGLLEDLKRETEREDGLMEKLRDAEAKISSLETALDVEKKQKKTSDASQPQHLAEVFKAKESKYTKELSECKQDISEYRAVLNERDSELDSLRGNVSTLQSQVHKLQEELARVKEDDAKKYDTLKNHYDDMCESFKQAKEEYNRKVNKVQQEAKEKEASQKKLVESYRERAQDAVDRYIKTKATGLGIKSVEIKNRLDENYTFDDVDRVCEDLRQQRTVYGSMPFMSSAPAPTTAKVSTADTQSPIKQRDAGYVKVDDTLVGMFKTASRSSK